MPTLASMPTLAELWLPILLSGVFVFIASSIFHMVIPLHRGDYVKMPGEQAILEVMHAQALQPGQYMFPCAGSMKEMSSPEMIEKCVRGPVGWLTVIPSGPPSMGKNLVQWFLFTLLVSLLIAYLATLALPRGADYMTVFRLTGTAGILGYALSNFLDSIWKGSPWKTTLKFVFDGAVYGLVTAGTFGWLWPGPA